MIDAIVTSARELSAEELNRIEEKFSQMLGDMLNLEVRVDPSLIGGVRVEAGGMMYDGSVSTRLSDMLRTMLAEDRE